MNNIIHKIRQIYPVSEEALQALLMNMQVRHYPKGTYIVQAGVTDRLVYFIEEGVTRSVFHHDGQDTTTWFSQEGDVTFGMDSLYYQQPSVESIETLSDCKIYVIHIDKLNALYETYIDIANWGRILHQNVNKELSHMFVERLQLPPKERYEQFNRRYPRLINRVKLKYVAAFLGISIYTLSRVRGKKIEDVKIVVSGSGAAGIACARMYKTLGAKNVIMVDSKGVIYEGRENLSHEKMEFAIKTDARTLSDAMKNADMFLGLSKAGIVSKDMVKSMAKNPIVFALANPDPEISPKDVKDTRDDAIIGTGRSDYPNQINNILGFPYIFRGALDVKSTNITENMKMAAAKALAELAREPVSDKVKKIVGNDKLEFGINYVIPNPFDERVFSRVALAVAKAAIEDGVALIKDFDLKKYKERLEAEK